MTQTTNLQLNKPESADYYDVSVQNENMDIIDTEIQKLSTSKAEITEVNELKKSVSDGKTLVANAITGKGITTATNATFATMATNIGAIKVGIDTTDATATAAQILSGATAYVKGKKITGTAIAGKKYATGTLSGVKAETYHTYANAIIDGDASTNTVLRGFTVTCDFVPEVIVYTAGYPDWKDYFRGFVSSKRTGETGKPYNGETIYIGKYVCSFATTIGKSTNIALWSLGNTTTLDITWHAFG